MILNNLRAKTVTGAEVLKIAFYTVVINLKHSKKGQTMTELFWIAGGVIVCAFVFIPWLRNLGTKVTTGISDWYDGNIAPVIFPKS